MAFTAPSILALTTSIWVVIQLCVAQSTTTRLWPSTNPYTIRISEESRVGTTVLAAPRSQSYQVEYSLIENPNDLFQISPNDGAISLDKQVDAEVISPHTFQIIAQANKLLSDRTTSVETIPIVVKIIDTNDNGPQFDKESYQLSVGEDIEPGDLLPFVMIVTDNDSTQANRKMNIVLNNTQYFRVIYENGVSEQTPVYLQLKPNTKLDYETEPIIYLGVQATNTQIPNLRAVASVRVQLLDVNDVSPKFSQDKYSIDVTELTKPGTLITREIKATDAENPTRISYSLLGEDANTFVMDVNTGDLSLGQDGLDYERKSLYELQVVASDAFQQSFVPLTISVININDHMPQFDKNTYKTSLKEHTTELKPPVVFKITDVDNDPTTIIIAQGNIFDTITREPLFKLVDNQLIVTRPVIMANTRNGAGSIALSMEATDNTFRSFATVDITVIDANDFDPICENETVYNVKETDPPGSKITQIKARDDDIKSSDLAGKFFFTIESGNNGQFRIDQNTGEVQLTNSIKLDYNEQNYYNITISVSDKGDPVRFGRCYLQVNIEDVNNKAPIVDPLTKGNIYVGSNPGTRVVRVSASDPDIGANLLYTIQQDSFAAEDILGNSLSNNQYRFGQWFAIDQNSGYIGTRDRIPLKTPVSVVTFTVAVSDTNGQSEQITTTFVYVKILNDNKFYPKFELDKYNLEVNETMPVGALITTFVATDIGGIIERYGLESVSAQDLEYFRLDPNSGALYLNQSLDYESGRSVVRMSVTAEDNGHPIQTATAPVAIIIKNVNEHEPVFISNVFQGHVTEHATVGQDIVQIVAQDGDHDSAGLIKYSIFNVSLPEFEKTFQINEGSGWISVADNTMLDAELFKDIELIVEAQDTIDYNNPISYKNAVKVKITIDDINDHSPVFNSSEYTVDIADTTVVKTTILTVTAHDGDRDKKYSTIEYKLEESSDDFTIDSKTGDIKTARSFYNRNGSYPFKVVALDYSGLGFNSRSVQVTVNVLLNNFFVPHFEKPPSNNVQILNVREDGQKTQFVYQVRATDRMMSSDRIHYYFYDQGNLSSTAFDAFEIDDVSGTIVTLSKLDREKTAVYNLLLAAVDINLEYPQVATRQLTVVVGDTNDNIPRFHTYSNSCTIPLQMYVSETAPKNTRIGIARAYDADSARFSIIHYDLIKGNSEIFKVNRLTGEVTIGQTIDFEIQSTYKLKILATDASTSEGLPARIEDLPTCGDKANVVEVVVNVINTDDRAPTFENSIYDACIPFNSQYGTFVKNVSAVDNDAVPSVINYKMMDIKWNKNGLFSPVFCILNVGHLNGTVYTTSLVSPYVDTFVVGYLEASDEAGRTGNARVRVWITRNEDEIVFVFRKSLSQVELEKTLFIAELEKCTKGIVCLNKLRDHVDKFDGSINPNWVDAFVHVIDRETLQVYSSVAILRMLDTCDSAGVIPAAFTVTGFAGAAAVVAANEEAIGLWLIIAVILIWLLILLALLLLCCCCSCRSTTTVEKFAYADDETLSPKMYEEQQLQMNVDESGAGATEGAINFGAEEFDTGDADEDVMYVANVSENIPLHLTGAYNGGVLPHLASSPSAATATRSFYSNGTGPPPYVPETTTTRQIVEEHHTEYYYTQPPPQQQSPQSAGMW